MPDDRPRADETICLELPSRSFTLLDAMILVAALAIAAAGSRPAFSSLFHLEPIPGEELLLIFGPPPAPKPGILRMLFEWEGWAAVFGPLLVALTTGLLACRLIPPRPPWRKLFRQPGFLAAVVAVVLALRNLLSLAQAIRASGKTRFIELEGFFDDWLLRDVWRYAITEVAFGIAIAWSVVALARCSRSEPTWIDRTLRALGVFWVLAGVWSVWSWRVEYASFTLH